MRPRPISARCSAGWAIATRTSRSNLRILLVTATDPEIAPLVARLTAAVRRQPAAAPLEWLTFGRHEVRVLTTGVGMVATAAWCSRVLAQSSFDLALNLGVCGAFDRDLLVGEAVHVTRDRLAELGAEDGERFLTVQELNLLGEDEFPYQGGELVNATPPASPPLSRLAAVSGITVNTVHGSDGSISAVVSRFEPQVESMEGAAFMYACLVHGVPFAQVRAVSNVVERRNRAGWKLADAIGSVTRVGLEILESL